MTSTQAQIVKAYEELHLSIADICEEFEFDEVEVKMILEQCSVVYRKAVKENKTLGFTDEQHEIAIAKIYNTMMNTEDENLASRLAKYIREDATGRRDAAKNMAAVMLPTIEFNIELKKARMALERTRQVKSLEIKDVEEVIPEAPAPVEKQLEKV